MTIKELVIEEVSKLPDNATVEEVLKVLEKIGEMEKDRIYSEESMKTLRKSITDLNAGNKITKTMEELEAMEEQN